MTAPIGMDDRSLILTIDDDFQEASDSHQSLAVPSPSRFRVAPMEARASFSRSSIPSNKDGFALLIVRPQRLYPPSFDLRRKFEFETVFAINNQRSISAAIPLGAL